MCFYDKMRRGTMRGGLYQGMMLVITILTTSWPGIDHRFVKQSRASPLVRCGERTSEPRNRPIRKPGTLGDKLRFDLFRRNTNHCYLILAPQMCGRGSLFKDILKSS